MATCGKLVGSYIESVYLVFPHASILNTNRHWSAVNNWEGKTVSQQPVTQHLQPAGDSVDSRPYPLSAEVYLMVGDTHLYT